jgi:hypothetical protein
MTRERRYLLMIALALGVLVWAEFTRPTPIDWSESYTAADRIPYGAYALRELLGEIFPADSIANATMPVYNMLDDDSVNAPPGNYIFINSALHFDDLDRELLLEFAGKGGNVFIAATWIDNDLTDTLGIELEVRSFYMAGDDTLEVSLVNPKLKRDSPWRFRKIGSLRYFSDFDPERTTVLGMVGGDQPNFIRVRHGEGAFYLNMLPLAFTNYHLLDSANLEYPFRALSYLPPTATLWDEHYKEGRHVVESPLRYLLSQEALRWGYYLMLAGAGLFIFVHARRRQRIIPEMAPPANATLDFVETVGMLYLNSGDHAGIARKQISYLLEHLRSTYGVRTDERGAELYETVAKRSGVSDAEVRDLFHLIGRIEGRERISEEELRQLNASIEKFNNSKER